jgi:hypothetical protein
MDSTSILKIRKDILEGMVNYALGANKGWISVKGTNPAFKPGTGDLMIFNRIIDEYLPSILDDAQFEYTNGRMIGFNLMVKVFYPKYF